MNEMETDWRTIEGVATAWFDAPSLTAAASLVGCVVELSAEIVVDLRETGLRVSLDSDENAHAVSAASRDLGLAATPAVLQQLSVVLESANPSVVGPFWQRVLDYAPAEDSGLADAVRPCDTDPGVARAAAVAQPHPPRRGAAGRGGRAGEAG
jgi:hypothetical protein